MAGRFTQTVLWLAARGYGLFTIVLYGAIAIRQGTFFTKRTEKQSLELQIARDRLWNLSKDFEGLAHHILTLPSRFKFHMVSNETPNSPAALKSDKPLVIFIHGFPDSWAIWRHIISSASLQNAATVVAIDLPGYGGSQALERYTATSVLEKLTELIITLRIQYGVDDDSQSSKKKTIIVGHDWGCLLAMRLAAEAPALADRFILTNGPLPSLVRSNIDRLIMSASKMFNTALGSPLQARTPILQALRTVSPLFRQLLLSGYVFAMQLPVSFVRYMLVGGNQSLMKGCHKQAHGGDKFTPRDEADSMASTQGPSRAESTTQTSTGATYPDTIQYGHEFANVMNMAGYYRDDAVLARWEKSIETVASLHGIAGGKELRRTSSGAGLLDEGAPGVLKANSTILWGQKDTALDPNLCLNGIADYLVANSQVIMLPNSAHFTPIEVESRGALAKIVEWAVRGEIEDIEATVQQAYPSAKVIARR
ncbi:hypothetical protein N7462_007166 [Penicillium macrosclerotiorum]|uniref:uncharacterized protein n=1 Tax=Penicillium macrosclerotiorum TaxID=303699 RepID=UPI0025492CE6|nr:uncharacterized protein N7462_007166 [Penicillium macrosclerotiorum]KAJ5678922.1 hypothetical protein N7462_007166 [Penicillium macrosclerotiorum]